MLASEDRNMETAAEVNKDGGQELPIAPPGLSRDATAEQSFMRRFDENNNGVIDVRAAAVASRELRSSLSYARKVALGALGLVLLSWLGNAGLTTAVVVLAKDTYVKGDTTMANSHGEVVGTRMATHNLPLIVAPVLPDDELFSVETLRVTLPGSTTDPTKVSSGFRISRVDRTNSTAVEFHALGGERIRVWNGVTTVRLSASGPEIPVCSADVTCAAFQVEGAELAEKYLAQAEALLVPFEGRRRLAEECLDEPSLSAVFLGTAGNFAILTKTGITTTGKTDVTGDMGTSPIAATALTGFDLTMHSSTTYSTSDLVTGQIFAASYTSPTPSKMTTAISDMQTAYTDAAGRVNPKELNLGAGTIEGMTLEPGLYKWGSSVGFTTLAFNATQGNANAVWILQMTGDLNVGAGAFITLLDGAKEENIFWQVAGSTTLSTTAAMKGTILCATAIDFQTGSSLNGKALAQTAVTLDAATIVKF